MSLPANVSNATNWGAGMSGPLIAVASLTYDTAHRAAVLASIIAGFILTLISILNAIGTHLDRREERRRRRQRDALNLLPPRRPNP